MSYSDEWLKSGYTSAPGMETAFLGFLFLSLSLYLSLSLFLSLPPSASLFSLPPSVCSHVTSRPHPLQSYFCLPHFPLCPAQEMEQPGRLLPSINELHHMLRTPIKPFSPSEPEVPSTGRKHRHRRSGKTSPRLNPEPCSGDEDETGGRGEDESSSGSSNESPSSSSPRSQRSSSDNGSDLEDLLVKDFPNEDLPSLITRAIGKGGLALIGVGDRALC